MGLRLSASPSLSTTSVPPGGPPPRVLYFPGGGVSSLFAARFPPPPPHAGRSIAASAAAVPVHPVIRIVTSPSVPPVRPARHQAQTGPCWPSPARWALSGSLGLATSPVPGEVVSPASVANACILSFLSAQDSGLST